MRPMLFALLLLSVAPLHLPAQDHPVWRAATPAELEAALPARAPVEKERIETEMRTASGIIDDHGDLIASVVLITAGYAADGKYSHYLLAQHAIAIGGLLLPAGKYVIGWSRTEGGLLVQFYDAATGVERGAVTAKPLPEPRRVESFRIWAPSEHREIQIGRFFLPYRLP